MLQYVRDPKWIAIGFAAIVVCGVGFKLFVGSGTDVQNSERSSRPIVTAATAELGRYELGTTSWAKKQNEPPPSTREQLRPETRSRFDDRRWSGICVAVQRN